jgi:hypothetical protein
VTISAGHLRGGLESEDAAAAKFAQPSQRVLEAVNGAQRIELVDNEPQFLVAARRLTHGFENRKVHPGGDH